MRRSLKAMDRWKPNKTQQYSRGKLRGYWRSNDFLIITGTAWGMVVEGPRRSAVGVVGTGRSTTVPVHGRA